ncbi:MAG: hypothetical protein AAGB02_08770 [Pseudomonadota bacterium]
MIWLIVHMWTLLAIAFVIGLGAGWWIWSGRKAAETTIEPTQQLYDEPKMGDLERKEETPDGSLHSEP